MKVCRKSSTASSSSNSISNSCDDQNIPSLPQGCMYPDPQSEPLETACVQQTDIVDDQAQQKLLKALKDLADARVPQEAMVILSQLKFGNYLNRQCFAASNARLPRPDDLGETYKDGDFDILIIHRKYGLIVGEVKSIGANKKIIQDPSDAVAMRLEKVIKQLYKAEAVLKHLASDLANVNVTKTVILPYVHSSVLEQALAKNPILEYLSLLWLHVCAFKCVFSDGLLAY
nr:hypothetical protein BaRGS_012407 [Batillaria attramentaria]